MESLVEDWRHIEWRLSEAKHRAWSIAKPSEETDAWALRLWSRMDRDRNGFLTRQELACEEFYNIVRAAVAPQSGLSTGGAAYSRTQVNVDAAIELCLRKADANQDSKLSFLEFRGLVRSLREKGPQDTANLVFALFDLDGNLYISRAEFQELLRFLLGRTPSAEHLETEWDRLVSGSENEFADQKMYIRWLQSSDDPMISQQLDVTQPEPSTATPQLSQLSSPTRPQWNQRFNAGINPGHVNDSRPQSLREYFSRSQTAPELKRYWESKSKTFRRHLEALYTPPSSAPKCKLFPKQLSASGTSPVLLPERHSPGGSMRDPTGELVAWHDYWSPPARYRRPFHKQDRPLLPFETFGDVRDATKIDSSPETLRRRNRELDARLRRRAKLGGPQRKCVLEAEPW